MNIALTSASIGLLTAGFLLVASNYALAQQSSDQDFYESLPQPDDGEFHAYEVQSIPAGKDYSSFGKIAHVEVEELIAYAKWRKVRVRALIPNDNTRCHEIGLSPYETTINGKLTPLCLIIVTKDG